MVCVALLQFSLTLWNWFSHEGTNDVIGEIKVLVECEEFFDEAFVASHLGHSIFFSTFQIFIEACVDAFNEHWLNGCCLFADLVERWQEFLCLQEENGHHVKRFVEFIFGESRHVEPVSDE